MPQKPVFLQSRGQKHSSVDHYFSDNSKNLGYSWAANKACKSHFLTPHILFWCVFKAQLFLFNHILRVSSSLSKDSQPLFLCCVRGSYHPVFQLSPSIPAEKSHPPILKSQVSLSAQELSPPIFSCLVAQHIWFSLSWERVEHSLLRLPP